MNLPRKLTVLTALSLTLLLSACGGGGGGGGGSSPAPDPAPTPDPEPSGFDYSFRGAAIKGAILDADINLFDAAGNPVGVSAITDNNGSFQVSFSLADELQLPLLIVVSGNDAVTVCDLKPVCRVSQDATGDPVTVSFGQTYPLPDGFRLRAAVESLDTDEDGTVTGSAFVSPLSEFVVAAALSLGDGTLLTAANLDLANERVASILGEVYPLLEIPVGLKIASVSLIDITNLANADFTTSNDLSLAISSISAALLGFVEPGSTEQADISEVLNDLSARINAAVGGTGPLLDGLTGTLLAEEAITSLEQTVSEIKSLETEGTVTLPEGISVSSLEGLIDVAKGALPTVVEITTALTADQVVTPSGSSGLAQAQLVYLPTTGEVRAKVDIVNTEATAVHLHSGFAGQAGPVLATLERDAGNASRWHLADDSLLDQDTMDRIANGQAYFDVHSENYPDGELRAQILPAGIETYITTPSGLELVPLPADSAGFIKAALTLNTVTNLAQLHLTGTGITITAAQLREGIAGAIGPVVAQAEPDPANGNHWFSADLPFNGELSGALASGRLYFSIETPEDPAGTLRGQLLPAGYDLRIASLDPAQVVAEEPVTSEAVGMIAVTTDLTANRLSAHVNLVGISSPTTVQIRQAAPGESGDSLFQLTEDALFSFVPQTGDLSHWFIESQPLNAAQLVLYLDNGLYVQAASAAYPQGELRGQLTRGSIDSDGDGVPNAMDAFPLDESESRDTDGDGVGDNADAFPEDATESSDSDGDGVGDNSDAFPSNPSETTDSDGDGTGDNADQCPNDPSGIVDSDEDGICDSEDPPGSLDADNDGVPDADDAFPNDPDETTDSDGDGVGDNGDVFPNNPAETRDSDGDGVGDNGDAFPNDPSEFLDSDGDGVGDNADAFPFDATESVDSDGDGIGDNADTCEVTVDPDNPDADGDGVVKDCTDVPAFFLVQEVFDSNCVACHGTEGGLSLSSGEAYGNLVNVPSTGVPAINRVEPGNADQSYLIWKLEGRDGIVGSSMPQGGVLPATDLDLIRRWINGGANP